MARLPRYVIPGQPQHVIQRGNNRSAMFVGIEDYLFFQECLADACERHGCAIHAYVFMTNHIHVIMTPSARHAIAKTMQSVGRRYVRYFNVTHGRTGTLWEGRYRATIIDSARYLLHCYRYVELNPVRAGMVTDPVEYRWSSHRANALGIRDTLVVPHAIYEALAPDAEGRRSVYRAICGAPVDASMLRTIRDATNKAWALGSDGFQREIGALAGRRGFPLYRVA